VSTDDREERSAGVRDSIRSLYVLTALPLLTLALAARAEPLSVYVAPNGDDGAAGSAERPFGTIQRARDEVRKRKAGGGAIVHVRGGVYRLAEPLVLGPEDSGTAEGPVVYEGERDGTAVISGGVVVSGWKVDERGWWRVRLPQVASGEWDFCQLFVGGRRRLRPRLPKGNQYFYIAGEVAPSEAAGGRGCDRFQFNAGEIRGDLRNLHDVEALCFSNWFMSRLPIGSVDETNHIVTLAGHTCSTEDYGKLHKGWRYLLENVADALGEPGEWYLDRKSGELTYAPKAGEEPGKTVVVAPRLEKLVILQGDVKGRRWVQNVTFRGLAFEHTNWVTPKEGYCSSQSEVPVPGAITAVGARGCAIERCAVRHVGTYAIEWGEGCKDDRVERCVLSDLGAGGIKIGSTGVSSDGEAIASHNVVRDTLINGGGRVHPGAIGVIVFQSPDNVVQHNEIVDFYYTGISSGWTWGYGKCLATGNQYLDNYVHRIGQGVLSDMGGIYTLGNHAGSVIRGNRFEEIESFSYGGWGIYFDEGTTDLVAENNLVIGTKTGGFHQHYGKDNVMRNNVLVNGREQWLERSRVEPEHRSFTFERNIVIGDQPRVFKGNWKDQLAVDHNVYWDTKGEPPQFNGQTLEQWQKASGQDAHSVAAEPGLEDVMRGDCRAKAGAAAERVGFKSLDVRGAGLEHAAAEREAVGATYPTARAK
jgi:hypothetical protein